MRTGRLRPPWPALGALGLLVLACWAGPPLLPVEPEGDPVRAALLSPLTSVDVLEMGDGTTIVAPGLSRHGADLLVTWRRGELEVDGGEVSTVRRHRYWLGSDRLGRDVLRRLLLGGRLSLAIAGSSLLLAVVVGTAIGIAAATGGRVTDAVLMRLVDALLAFPLLFLLILLAALLRPGPGLLVAVLALGAWMGTARLVRGQMLSLRSRPFILAARALGSPWHRIWRRHYLPHLAAPLAQDSALRLGDLVLAEATLSYLGLGVPASMPSWGSMVADGHRVLVEGWWISTFPGVALAALVIILALVGDGLQRSLVGASPDRRKEPRHRDVPSTEVAGG